MDRRNLKIYQTKDIYLGYVTTVNPDSYEVTEQITKTVLALKKQKFNKNQTILIPINTYFPYYSIDKTIPISMKMKRTGTFITSNEIDSIVEREKSIQRLTKTPVSTEYNNSKGKEIQIINAVEKEIEINKVKKLVA